MAFLDVYNDNGYGDAFYNVSAAVVINCHNMVEDVMLVQFFLKRFYLKLGSPRPSKINVDGICDSVTKTWIKAFQSLFKHAIHADGIVNRARTGTPFSSAFHSVYTIFLLNKFVRIDNNGWYLSLPFDTNAPARLRPLFINGRAGVMESV